MNRFSRIVGLVLMAGLASTLVAQDPASKGSKASDARQSLVGAWVLVGAPGATSEPRPDAELKFIGLSHFAVTKRNDQTGQIDYHHVGTYTLDGEQYTETVTHATGATAELAGKTFKFKIQVDGDKIIQHGLDNPWTQQWRRLGAAKKIERDDASKQ